MSESKRRAFQKRDYFTCSQCYNFDTEDGLPVCREFGKIKYNPARFGCGDYGCTDSGECEKPYRTTLAMFIGGKE